MQLYHALAPTSSETPIALTIGAFDGIHLGHQHLVGQVCASAARLGGESAVLTFVPHPDRVLRPGAEQLYLTPPEDRIELFDSLGIDHLYVLPFDRNLAAVPAETFMGQICAAMRLRVLWVGPDFRLGAGGRGTAPVLRSIGAELGFEVAQVARLVVDDQEVSSTAIRALLRAGQVEQANRLLGRGFALAGEVVHGDHRGRTIGFPTANVALAAEQFLPADGVYACHVYIPDETHAYPAVTNVGVRPTFGSLRRTVETHLIDWTGDLYRKRIRVVFLARLRGEQRFDGVDALVTQIRADVVNARELLTAS